VLILKRARPRRAPSGEWKDNDYDVLGDGKENLLAISGWKSGRLSTT
jgi:hypothetical protein